MSSAPSPSAPSSPAAVGAASEWSRVIEAEQPYFSLPWRELWKYRDLTLSLAGRDVTTSYKQTVLGPLWYLVQPLLITATFSYLFGRMAHFGSDDIPHYLFYMGGLVPWGFFSESVLKTSNVFVDNSGIFSKVYFPRLCVPIATLISNLLPTAAQFLLFLAGLIYYLVKGDTAVHPTWWILAVPLAFLQLGALALGFGCMVSALSRRFRDLAMGVRLGLQLLMFGSAIVFPLTRLAPQDRWIFFLNPVVPPIEFFRFAFLGRSVLQPWHMVLSASISVVLLLFGLLLFHRAEHNAMDTV